MTDPTALWDSVCKTPPSETKAITGKPYQGTSPKPYWIVRKATETFGPCGIGWGIEIVRERVEEGAAGEKVHIAHVRIWYVWGEKRGVVEHVGQTTFSGVRSSGKPFTDEDAPKKSVTDAMVKALSLIGFAGDIFMGRYDDSKYVNDLRAEEKAAAAPVLPPVRVITGKSIDEEEPTDSERKTVALLKAGIQAAYDADDLKDWWASAETKKLRGSIPKALHATVEAAAGQRLKELAPTEVAA